MNKRFIQMVVELQIQLEAIEKIRRPRSTY
jgi:hypothetical protein